MQTLTSNSIGGITARQFIPAAIVVPFVLGWLILQGQQAGWYDSSFGLSLMSLSLVVISLGLIRRNAVILNRVEQERKRSEERLQLAHAANIGTWDWDSETGEAFWSDQCYSLFGVSPTDPAFIQTWISSIHPEDLPKVQNAIQQCLTTGVVEIEYRIHHPEQGLRWIFSRSGLASDKPTMMRGISFDITDRKQTENALQQSEETVRQQLIEIESIYTTAPIGLCFMDTDLRFVRINEQLAQINGLPVAAHIGRTLREIIPEMADQLEPLYRQVIESGEPILNLELHGTIRAQPGVERDWLICYYPQTGADERVLGVNVMVQEITERKIAELSLREANQRIITAWESMTDAYVSLDCEWRFTYANQAAKRTIQRLTNLEPEAFLGKKHWEIFPWLVGKVVEQEYRRAMTEQVSVDIEFLYEPTQTWFEVHAYPSTLGLGIYFRDISARKQTESALRESETRFRTLADNIAQLAWIADENGWIFWYNRRWFDYTGTTLEEMQGWGWQQVHHPEYVERVVAGFRHCIETGTSWEDTFPLRSKDGEYRWFLSRAIPIRNEQGKVLCWFGTNTDITDRKQLEDTLEAQTAELIRTNRLKDEFLAVLSHELRTPLNPILGWTQLLKAQRLTPAKTAQALLTIERNVRQQIALIDDLLDVSRVIQGKLNLEFRPLDLALMLNAALETMQFTAQAKAITIELQSLPSLKAMGDGDRLQQVFWNLLSNAIKFTPEGGRVEVELSLQDAARYAQIRVTDTGIGIAPEFLPHVFEHFRQADGSSTRKYGGLGLGLAIVRHLVELHGGVVKADSKGVGQGSTFTVKLPLVTCTEAFPIPDSNCNDPPQTTGLTGKRILLVDDNPDNLDLLRFLLQQDGATVTAVTSPLEALLIITENPPELIISDIGMPQMNGYEFIRQVRALPQGGQIPALALTAFARHEDQEEAIASGFQAYIAKPVDPLQLLSAVRQLGQFGVVRRINC